MTPKEPLMQNDRLEAILNLYGAHITRYIIDYPNDQKTREILLDRATQSTAQAIRQWCKEVIGEDEWDESNVRDNPLAEIVARNALRAEQNLKLMEDKVVNLNNAPGPSTKKWVAELMEDKE